MADEELEELFPNLQEALSAWNPAPQPNGGVEESKVSQEELDEYLASQTKPVGPPPVEQTDETPEEEQPEEQLPPVEEVQVGDVTIPVQRIQAYEQFNELVKGDPKLQSLLDNYLRNGSVPQELVEGVSEKIEEETPPPTPPPELDLSDPVSKALWDRMDQQQKNFQAEIQRLSLGVNQTVALEQSRAMNEREALVRRAKASFQQQKGLTEEEVNQLDLVAARMNVLPSLASGIDPLTGVPTKPDVLTAVERALEIAYYSLPEYRQRDFRQWVENRREDNAKKRKLGALSGTSGSVSRSAPAPKTDEERREQMNREVAEMMAGNWSQPE